MNIDDKVKEAIAETKAMKIHEEAKKTGPKDCHFGDPKDVVARVEFARATSTDGEQMSISIPVFKEDTREMLDQRVHMFISLTTERMTAWNEVIDAQNQVHHQAQMEAIKAREALTMAKAEAKRARKKHLKSVETTEAGLN